MPAPTPITAVPQPSSRAVDATLVTDPRFMGGTAQAFCSDVLALTAAGLRVGVVFHRSGRFFRDTDRDNPALLALLDLPGVETVPARSDTIFLHNPQVFGSRQWQDVGTPLLPPCRRLFMVAHHPPFLGNGALCYDPVAISRHVKRRTGAPGPVEWLPVSGLVRAQLRSFQPLIAVSAVDWVNSFDLTHWTAGRDKLMSPNLTIGRHGRPHPDKWPDQPQDIAASLPADALTRVRLLGADHAFFAERGVDSAAWDILPFGGEPVQGFLDSLDVFSYFHAANWREAFGRTIAEAMLMGVRCILDPALRPTFGPHALYCAPADTALVLAQIRADLGAHRQAAQAAGDWCRASFGTDRIAARYQAVLGSAITFAPGGARATPPLTTLRKWIGFHMRQKRMSHG